MLLWPLVNQVALRSVTQPRRKKKMTNALRWFIWAVYFVLRFILILVGVIFPVHIFYETDRIRDSMSLWERYWENCWRNPTPYLRGWFKQPIPEVQPNPDFYVRTSVGGLRSSTRIMVSGPYIEYWKLSRRDNKKRPYWETRIGWKFVDGDDTFWPTLQFGPRK
jgi:hypothetical protein